VYISILYGLVSGADIASGERSGKAQPNAIRMERILEAISHLHEKRTAFDGMIYRGVDSIQSI
jgi:hypothetical protein